MESQKYILLGKITKPHGLKGEVKVYPYTERPENFRDYEYLQISLAEGAPWRPVQREKVRVQGKQVILKLRECSERTCAEALVGSELRMDASYLPSLDEGAFYLHQLEGKAVVDEQGQELGMITGFMSASGQDLLCITHGKEEFLIPAVRDFIVDIRETEVTLCLPEGLLMINQAASSSSPRE